MPHDIRAIANKILDVAEESGQSLTAMQLIKLSYLVHGWSYAFFDSPIVENSPQAWQYGPVYPELYREVARKGSAPIRMRIKDEAGIPFTAKLSDHEDFLVRQVVKEYGGKHAYILSNITHKKGTPWEKVHSELGDYHEIPEHLIREHFENLKRERGVGEIPAGV